MNSCSSSNSPRDLRLLNPTLATTKERRLSKTWSTRPSRTGEHRTLPSTNSQPNSSCTLGPLLTPPPLSRSAPGMTREQIEAMALCSWERMISKAKRAGKLGLGEENTCKEEGEDEDEDDDEPPHVRAARICLSDPDVMAMKARMRAQRGEAEEAHWYDIFEAVRSGEDEVMQSHPPRTRPRALVSMPQFPKG